MTMQPKDIYKDEMYPVYCIGDNPTKLDETYMLSEDFLTRIHKVREEYNKVQSILDTIYKGEIDGYPIRIT